jgi:regulatory protein
MPKILEIKKYPKIKNYFKIVFDNDTSALIDAETIVVFGLKKNLFVDDDTFNKILKHNNSNRITSYAFYLIEHKMYSKKSLTDKLLQKGFEPADVETVVEKFCRLNYINDKNFATELIKYLTAKGKGPFYIKNELKLHNIDNELISELLDGEQEKPAHLQIIDLIKKRYPNFDGRQKNEVRKIAMFFQRRGFSSEDIAKAFRTIYNL